MTTQRAEKRAPNGIRKNIPPPDSPEGRLFHYTFAEAAQWTPYAARTLREMTYSRETDYATNGRDSYLTGEQICAIAAAATVPRHDERKHTPAA